MKAIVQHRYGTAEDLTLEDIPKPEIRGDEVLVRVRAASVHADVWHVVTGLPYVLRLMGSGWKRPTIRVPGTDIAGIVERVGGSVTRFRAGDEVFGETLRGRMQWVNGGAFAEHSAAPEFALAHKPSNVSFEQAAAVPTAAMIALENLQNQGRIRDGQRVLINGAGGGVGSIALQLAKAFGTEVTAVDSPEKHELLRELGADHIIDYTKTDFTEDTQRYDLVFDIPGNHALSKCRHVLTPTGIYVLIGHDHYGRGMHRWLGQLPRMFGLMALSMFIRQLPKPVIPGSDRAEPMTFLAKLLAEGTLRPHIDRAFSLTEVPAALRYLEAGKAKGKIVITV
jgi:NADPH:quinone reductase-like Zn-dependent oxidoreductase